MTGAAPRVEGTRGPDYRIDELDPPLARRDSRRDS